MLDEYALIPDIFDPQSYSNPAFIEMCLPHLKEPILQEALIRNLADDEWSRYCKANSGTWHRLAMEILSKLAINNRLRNFPRQAAAVPTTASEWCNEALESGKIAALTGIISAHITKQQFPHPAVASIEKPTGTNWWQCRSPSVSVDRKTAQYLKVLDRVLTQSRSLMFIDPNLDQARQIMENSSIYCCRWLKDKFPRKSKFTEVFARVVWTAQFQANQNGLHCSKF